ncbi:hypothetical protein [Roseivirga sp.]|uniref:hypothetical protein n=1 Tax=Roseivirga sp. TaxID=1964215 RepID=UPI003B51C00B
MERVTGIWLDFDKAYIYHLQNGENEFLKVDSGVEHHNPKGGSGNSVPYGPQEAISEKHYLERRKHQTKDYYADIHTRLGDSSEVVIMGPAEAKLGLHRYLESINHAKFKLHAALTMDSMTENQVKAAIRDFYQSSGD